MGTETMALTAAQAAHELQISVGTLYAWVKAGKISYFRIGRKYLFGRKSIEEFLESGTRTVDSK
jgi:excisionase family DNA binding protein